MAEDDKLNGRRGGGDSGGGAYPNPHSGKEAGGKEGFTGTGGQTEMPYHGGSRLGDEETGDNPNASPPASCEVSIGCSSGPGRAD